MTERGRTALARTPERFALGPSTLCVTPEGLEITVRETSAPWPRRVVGRITVRPTLVNASAFALDLAGRHMWRPIAPLASVSVEMETPGLAWTGQAYLDSNWGVEPLEVAFRRWTWSRRHLADGRALIQYDVELRDGSAPPLTLEAGATGGLKRVEDKGAPRPLPRGVWGVDRAVRAEPDEAIRLVRTLEDAPFYTRSALTGGPPEAPSRIVHESLDLDRLTSPLVRLMLPFRMPRALAQGRPSNAPP
jgi:carotenoid 1,2-hydratase